MQIASRSVLDRLEQFFVLVAHRQNNDADVWLLAEDQAYILRPIAAWQIDIHQNNVGAQVVDFKQRLPHIAGLADNRHIRLDVDNIDNALTEKEVIICHQNGQVIHLSPKALLIFTQVSFTYRLIGLEILGRIVENDLARLQYVAPLGNL